MLPTCPARHLALSIAVCLGLAPSLACSNDEGDDAASSTSPEPRKQWECQLEGEEPVAYAQELGCLDDLLKLASEPLSASIPGAQSVKTLVDTNDDNALFFQNSRCYRYHWNFARAFRSRPDIGIVASNLGEFNSTEYTSPYRRFLLGAVTYYDGPKKYCYEIANNDTSTAEMITTAYELVAEHTYFGNRLYFHPLSQAAERVATELPQSIRVISTDELYEDIDYQPLNPAESCGKLRFVRAEDLEWMYLESQDIVVLDRVPNDISWVLGIITEEFQTPLSHINVLSSNRGTPNMALRGAFSNEDLRDKEGQWVCLRVEASDWDIERVDEAEAEAWWQEHGPAEVQIPGIDLTVTDLRDMDDAIDVEAFEGVDDPEGKKPLYLAIKAATRAFGGKAAHYGALRGIEGLQVKKAFAIPVYYYVEFMEENGFAQRVADLLADQGTPDRPGFANDAATRDWELARLRDDMRYWYTYFNSDFLDAVVDKLRTTPEYAGKPMRFRSSTNAEDLAGFTGAGLYTSATADPVDAHGNIVDVNMDEVKAAILEVWSSVWYFRAFEERNFRGIDHQAVAMALLVHPSFPAEEANGVAITNNIFSCSEDIPGYYVNVQIGDLSVVQPPEGCTTDEFIYHYDSWDAEFISHSNLLAQGSTVLTRRQMHDLGVALGDIHQFFRPAYQPPIGSPSMWWAMDVEFKFDGDVPNGEEPSLWIKQARPFATGCPIAEGEKGDECESLPTG